MEDNNKKEELTLRERISEDPFFVSENPVIVTGFKRASAVKKDPPSVLNFD